MKFIFLRVFVPFLFLQFLSTFLIAHSIGVSKGTYSIHENMVVSQLIFARPELLRAFPEIDVNRDGLLTEAELIGASSTWKAMISQITATSTAGTCTPEFQNAQLTEEDGVILHASHRCSEISGNVAVRIGFFESLTHGHRHIATVNSAVSVAYSANPGFEVAGTQRNNRSSASAFFVMGMEHILTGYDHLVFLFGLIVVGSRLRPLLLIVSAFTLGHSVTLAITALGIWTPNPAFIEPAIALSITYIGIENLFVTDVSRRWMITLPFGLIHGFGFGGALREIAVAPAEVPLALATFNLGVEAGQIAILALTLPLVLLLRRRTWFASQGVKGLSTGIALAGCCWFILRLL